MTTVFSRLPTDVVIWVSDNVTLHEPPEDNCVGFEFKSETTWHIIFPHSLFAIPVKDRIFTMVHEIAHCYLEHEKEYGESKTMVKSQEDEADTLATKWGF